MRQFLFFIICLFCVLTKVNALSNIDINVSSKNAILYYLTDDKIMFEKNSTQRIKIASMTKIMTAIVAIENISNLDEEITITDNDYKNVYSQNLAIVGFKVGQTVTYRDLLYGLLLKSGADCGYALADSIAGNEEAFVEMVNEKAKDLQLVNTKFTNVVGYDQDNYSTVYDVTIFFKYALENKIFKEMLFTKSYTTTDGTFTLKNVTDELLLNSNIQSNYRKYILGGKTGYTIDAKYCLASVAEYDGTTYIAVTALGNQNQHIKDAMLMYETAFDNYTRKRIVGIDDYLVSFKTPTKEELKVFSNQEVDVLLPNEASKDDVKLEYKGITNIDDKIKKNEVLGKVNLEYNGEIVKTIDIVYDKKIQSSLNYHRITQPIKRKKHLNIVSIVLSGVGGFILIVVLMFIISMYIDVKKNKRRWKFKI